MPKEQPREYGRTDVKAMRNDKTSYNRMDGEYVLSDGKHLLRFLPPKEDGPFYFKYFTHRLPGGDFHICPKMTWKKACPICVLGDNLFRSRDVDEIDQGRKLYRKPAYIANAIDVRDPDKGVQLVRFGVQVRDQIAEFFADPDDDQDQGIDVTDPDEGATVRITKVPPASKGDFPKYLASLGKQGPVPLKQWHKKLFDLEEVIKKITKSTEELRSLLADAITQEEAPGTEGRTRRTTTEEEEEDNDPKPTDRRRAAVDGEDDDPEDFKPARRKAAAEDEENEDPKPTGKRKFPVEEEEEEEEAERPRRGKR